MTTATKHNCYRCVVHDIQGPFSQQGVANAPELESLAATYSESGEEVFVTSGYSAREISQRRAREIGGQVYVNNVSRKIKRRDLTVPVAYAVSKSPVYTLMGSDQWHEKTYRAYWRPL